MENHVEDLDKIRQQFNTAPYPRIELDVSPKNDLNLLYLHNFITPFYLRNQQIANSETKLILDVGCGSGYTSLTLAEANPEARIVGIDISEKSVELARQRLKYHGFNNAEFHTLLVEDLPSLNLQFDYINCDEVLYLLPDPVAGLKAMKAVLKPDGIVRANLHSSLQREFFYRAQTLFKMMGLMDGPPEDLEIELVREVMGSLKDQTFLKQLIWRGDFETDSERVRANLLLQGDKGYTMTELFAALREADLEFVSMVKWRQWELTDLFKDPEDLPAFLAMSVPDLSVEERLRLFELLHPVHRLIDFWCAHPDQAKPFTPIADWTDADWLATKVHLHPQLKRLELKQELIDSVRQHKPFEITQYIPSPTVTPFFVTSTMAACLLPLWDGPQPFRTLVERWLKIKPLDPVTLESVGEQEATSEIKSLLRSLEVFLYVLLEKTP